MWDTGARPSSQALSSPSLRSELSLLPSKICSEAQEGEVAQGLCHLAVVGSVGTQADSQSLALPSQGTCAAKAVQEVSIGLATCWIGIKAGGLEEA